MMDSDRHVQMLEEQSGPEIHFNETGGQHCPRFKEPNHG